VDFEAGRGFKRLMEKSSLVFSMEISISKMPGFEI
jgi:hypothetical protein